MPYQLPPDVEEQVQRQIASGKYANEDEVLREAMHALAIEEAHTRAIQEALDAVEAGDPGIPLDEVYAEMRTKYGIP